MIVDPFTIELLKLKAEELQNSATELAHAVKRLENDDDGDSMMDVREHSRACAFVVRRVLQLSVDEHAKEREDAVSRARGTW